MPESKVVSLENQNVASRELIDQFERFDELIYDGTKF